jgi:predicted DsbA family dithiol-disulfide isomerase
MSVTRKLTVFFDFACPLCYTDTIRLKTLGEQGIEVEWRAWQRPEGVEESSRHGADKETFRESLQFIKKTYGISITPPLHSPNTFFLHVGGKHAAEQGYFERYRERIYKAIWEEDRNLNDHVLLAQLAAEIGLDGSEYRRALQQKRYHELVEVDFRVAERAQIRTVPSYIGEKGQIQVHHVDDLPDRKQLKKLI